MTFTSCKKEVPGCTEPNAINYDASATENDGSCIAKVYGCMDATASNYNPYANTSDGSCVYNPYGAGMGKHSFFFLQDCGLGALSIYIDGVYRGSLGMHFSQQPDCDDPSIWSVILPSGTHHYYCEYSNGSNYESDFNMVENLCLMTKFGC